MASADTAIDDDLRSSVARRTFASRDRGPMPPDRRSPRTLERRGFPRVSGLRLRPNRGTRQPALRRLRPFVDSPREARSSCRPIATAVSTTSLIVPLKEDALDRPQSVERDVGGGEASRGSGRTVEGTPGGSPMPAGARRAGDRPNDGLDRSLGRAPRCLQALSAGWDVISSKAAWTRSSRGGIGFGSPRGGRRRAERCVRLEVEQSRSDQHAADPVRERVVKLQEDGRPSASTAFGARRAPRGLRSIERSGEDAGRPIAPTGADRRGTERPSGGGGRSRSDRSSSTRTGYGRCCPAPEGHVVAAGVPEIDPGLDSTACTSVAGERRPSSRGANGPAVPATCIVCETGSRDGRARIQTGEAFAWPSTHARVRADGPTTRAARHAGRDGAHTGSPQVRSRPPGRIRGGSAAPRLPPGVGPGREPVPYRVRGNDPRAAGLRHDQAAVDHAEAGRGMVLVAPGSIGSR